MRRIFGATRFLSVCLLCLAATGVQAGEETITTELVTSKTLFRAEEPIVLDVFITSDKDTERNQLSPFSSCVRLPDFVIRRVPEGKEFAFNPGFFGNDTWDQWYQPASGIEALRVGTISLPAGKRIHLLHGDLRNTVVQSREHCQRALADEKDRFESPEYARTKMNYQDIIRFADDFLKGGTFDVFVNAYSYSQSNSIRIEVESGSEPSTRTVVK